MLTAGINDVKKLKPLNTLSTIPIEPSNAETPVDVPIQFTQIKSTVGKSKKSLNVPLDNEVPPPRSMNEADLEEYVSNINNEAIFGSDNRGFTDLYENDAVLRDKMKQLLTQLSIEEK